MKQEALEVTPRIPRIYPCEKSTLLSLANFYLIGWWDESNIIGFCCERLWGNISFPIYIQKGMSQVRST